MLESKLERLPVELNCHMLDENVARPSLIFSTMLGYLQPFPVIFVALAAPSSLPLRARMRIVSIPWKRFGSRLAIKFLADFSGDNAELLGDPI